MKWNDVLTAGGLTEATVSKGIRTAIADYKSVDEALRKINEKLAGEMNDRARQTALQKKEEHESALTYMDEELVKKITTYIKKLPGLKANGERLKKPVAAAEPAGGDQPPAGSIDPLPNDQPPVPEGQSQPPVPPVENPDGVPPINPIPPAPPLEEPILPPAPPADEPEPQNMPAAKADPAPKKKENFWGVLLVCALGIFGIAAGVYIENENRR